MRVHPSSPILFHTGITANPGQSLLCGKHQRMFKDTHPHLFNIAGSKDSCGDNTLRVLSRAKAPRLYGTSLDKNDRSKAIEILRRFRCTVACEVLRSCDENGHRLP